MARGGGLHLHLLAAHVPGLHDRSYKPPREFNWVVGVNLLTLRCSCPSPATCFPGPLGDLAVTVGTQHGPRHPLLGQRGRSGISMGMTAALRRARCPAHGGNGVGWWVMVSDLAPLLRPACNLHPIIASILIAHPALLALRKDGGISVRCREAANGRLKHPARNLQDQEEAKVQAGRARGRDSRLRPARTRSTPFRTGRAEFIAGCVLSCPRGGVGSLWTPPMEEPAKLHQDAQPPSMRPGTSLVLQKCYGLSIFDPWIAVCSCPRLIYRRSDDHPLTSTSTPKGKDGYAKPGASGKFVHLRLPGRVSSLGSGWG